MLFPDETEVFTVFAEFSRNHLSDAGNTSPEYLDHAFGFYGSVASCAMPIGLMISGAFADTVGTTNCFLLAGVLIVL